MHEKLKKLQYGVNKFKVMGKAVITEKSFGKPTTSNSGYKYVRDSFAVDAGEGKRPYVTIMGGYNETTKGFKGYSSKEKKYVDIKWDFRHNEEILADIAPSSFLRVSLEQDENGKLIEKKFLDYIEAAEYLEEHLSNEMEIGVSGDVEYNHYNGKISRNYNVTNIWANLERKQDDGSMQRRSPMTQLIQTYLLDATSLKSGWKSELKKTGVINVDAFVPQYMKMYNGHEVKEVIPVSQRFLVKANNEDEKDIAQKIKWVEKLLTVKKGIVREIVINNEINEGYSTSTGVELNDEMRELIELGLETEESIQETAVIRGDRVAELIFRKPHIDKGEDGKLHIQSNDDKYAPEALQAPVFDGDTDEEEEDGAGEGMSDLENDLGISSDDLASLLND